MHATSGTAPSSCCLRAGVPAASMPVGWQALKSQLSLLKNMFGLGSERPPMASGNSLLVEWRLGRGCDLAILVGLRMP